MFKLRSWGWALVLAIAVGGVVFGQSLALSKNSLTHSIENIPMPKLENPLRILTPANEIFEIASCSTKDFGFAITNAQIPPGAGPLPHVHYYINEFFWPPQGGIEIFHSERKFPDMGKPPTMEAAGRASLYAITPQPKQVIYSPHTFMHGFVNPTDETLPITMIWVRDAIAPDFEYHDGGMREYFSAVGAHIEDLNNLPTLTEAQRNAFVTEAPKFGINQSSYMMQYVSAISDEFPSNLAKLENTQALTKVIETIEAFNRGDKSVTCS
ncbi:cupin domain-containing protein [Synechocystis salina]|uniref:Cupin domain-containing protein n=1 Tax=Synechocystis salina LEGE 00031 TaxID=1828736 RepID=A0ABR9VNX9_9SYNC|nr:cupin domain-containing protein [Synechocystis salina]MBE9241392.1 cupin domain-containing protein [Synechocystis salina LEGE 00041]MBE9253057.1 cupin domain-containing protein [Synechocystis salina LEGE 00031]